MARTLSALLQTETAKVVTNPFCLIRIDWSPVSYLSTGPTVSYDGQAWYGGSATLEELRSLAGGALEGRLSIGNTDGAIGAKVLSDSLSDVPVTIWLLYGAEPFTAGDALPVFAGVIDGATLTVTRVTLGLVSDGRRRLTGPRLYCQPPLCNHMPPAGTRLLWNGEVFILNGSGPFQSARSPSPLVRVRPRPARPVMPSPPPHPSIKELLAPWRPTRV